jgi:hypothetical protein
LVEKLGAVLVSDFDERVVADFEGIAVVSAVGD